MSFEIAAKVALISGDVSKTGLYYAKELLRCGLRGLTLADTNNELGRKALKRIEREFGRNKAIFVQTDVTNKQAFEEAFKRTIEVFHNLDIVINNVGIFYDAHVEIEINININVIINGTLLGLEKYIPKYKTGSEGVLVNIVSSIAGVGQLSAANPMYTSSKLAAIGVSKAFGDEAHHKRTNVRVLVMCPEIIHVASIKQILNKNTRLPCETNILNDFPLQEPEYMASAMTGIIKNAKAGTVWVVEANEKPYEFMLPHR